MVVYEENKGKVLGQILSMEGIKINMIHSSFFSRIFFPPYWYLSCPYMLVTSVIDAVIVGMDKR